MNIMRINRFYINYDIKGKNIEQNRNYFIDEDYQHFGNSQQNIFGQKHINKIPKKLASNNKYVLNYLLKLLSFIVKLQILIKLVVAKKMGKDLSDLSKDLQSKDQQNKQTKTKTIAKRQHKKAASECEGDVNQRKEKIRKVDNNTKKRLFFTTSKDQDVRKSHDELKNMKNAGNKMENVAKFQVQPKNLKNAKISSQHPMEQESNKQSNTNSSLLGKLLNLSKNIYEKCSQFSYTLLNNVVKPTYHKISSFQTSNTHNRNKLVYIDESTISKKRVINKKLQEYIDRHKSKVHRKKQSKSELNQQRSINKIDDKNCGQSDKDENNEQKYIYELWENNRNTNKYKTKLVRKNHKQKRYCFDRKNQRYFKTQSRLDNQQKLPKQESQNKENDNQSNIIIIQDIDSFYFPKKYKFEQKQISSVQSYGHSDKQSQTNRNQSKYNKYEQNIQKQYIKDNKNSSAHRITNKNNRINGKERMMCNVVFQHLFISQIQMDNDRRRSDQYSDQGQHEKEDIKGSNNNNPCLNCEQKYEEHFYPNKFYFKNMDNENYFWKNEQMLRLKQQQIRRHRQSRNQRILQSPQQYIVDQQQKFKYQDISQDNKLINIDERLLKKLIYGDNYEDQQCKQQQNNPRQDDNMGQQMVDQNEEIHIGMDQQNKIQQEQQKCQQQRSACIQINNYQYGISRDSQECKINQHISHIQQQNNSCQYHSLQSSYYNHVNNNISDTQFQPQNMNYPNQNYCQAYNTELYESINKNYDNNVPQLAVISKQNLCKMIDQQQQQKINQNTYNLPSANNIMANSPSNICQKQQITFPNSYTQPVSQQMNINLSINNYQQQQQYSQNPSVNNNFLKYVQGLKNQQNYQIQSINVFNNISQLQQLNPFQRSTTQEIPNPFCNAPQEVRINQNNGGLTFEEFSMKLGCFDNKSSFQFMDNIGGGRKIEYKTDLQGNLVPTFLTNNNNKDLNTSQLQNWKNNQQNYGIEPYIKTDNGIMQQDSKNANLEGQQMNLQPIQEQNMGQGLVTKQMNKCIELIKQIFGMIHNQQDRKLTAEQEFQLQMRLQCQIQKLQKLKEKGQFLLQLHSQMQIQQKINQLPLIQQKLREYYPPNCDFESPKTPKPGQQPQSEEQDFIHQMVYIREDYYKRHGGCFIKLDTEEKVRYMDQIILKEYQERKRNGLNVPKLSHKFVESGMELQENMAMNNIPNDVNFYNEKQRLWKKYFYEDQPSQNFTQQELQYLRQRLKYVIIDNQNLDCYKFVVVNSHTHPHLKHLTKVQMESYALQLDLEKEKRRNWTQQDKDYQIDCEILRQLKEEFDVYWRSNPNQHEKMKDLSKKFQEMRNWAQVSDYSLENQKYYKYGNDRQSQWQKIMKKIQYYQHIGGLYRQNLADVKRQNMMIQGIKNIKISDQMQESEISSINFYESIPDIDDDIKENAQLLGDMCDQQNDLIRHKFEQEFRKMKEEKALKIKQYNEMFKIEKKIIEERDKEMGNNEQNFYQNIRKQFNLNYNVKNDIEEVNYDKFDMTELNRELHLADCRWGPRQYPEQFMQRLRKGDEQRDKQMAQLLKKSAKNNQQRQKEQMQKLYETGAGKRKKDYQDWYPQTIYNGRKRVKKNNREGQIQLQEFYGKIQHQQFLMS